jgi:hypothetical protein
MPITNAIAKFLSRSGAAAATASEAIAVVSATIGRVMERDERTERMDELYARIERNQGSPNGL